MHTKPLKKKKKSSVKNEKIEDNKIHPKKYVLMTK